jgi:hypothetical protein
MRQTATLCSLVLFIFLGLDFLSRALAATITDTFQLKLTGTERCRNDPKFLEPIHVKILDGKTLTLTRDVLNTGDLIDIQATMNTHGDKATINAIALIGQANSYGKD